MDGAIQVLRNVTQVGVSNFLGEKCYEGVRFNVISIMRGWVCVNFPEKSITYHLNGLYRTHQSSLPLLPLFSENH